MSSVKSCFFNSIAATFQSDVRLDMMCLRGVYILYTKSFTVLPCISCSRHNQSSYDHNSLNLQFPVLTVVYKWRTGTKWPRCQKYLNAVSTIVITFFVFFKVVHHYTYFNFDVKRLWLLTLTFFCAISGIKLQVGKHAEWNCKKAVQGSLELSQKRMLTHNCMRPYG